MIGIRIADGSFFPVLEENSGRRKIVLTAANKGQEKVRIDFLSDDYHLGTIFLDGIKDDSDIELIMESVGRTLIATATDTRTGNRAILNAVLPAPEPEKKPEAVPVPPPEKKPEPEKKPVPEPEERPVRISRPASGAACSPVIDRTVRNLQILLFVMTVILAFLSGVVVYAVVNMPAVTEKGTVVMFSEPAPEVLPAPEPVPAAPEPIPEPEPIPAPEPEPIPEPVVSEPVAPPPAVHEPAPQPPVHCYPPVYHGCPYHRPPMPPATPPQPIYYVPEYIRYKVKYGDTLWSIARTFCIDPYMYLEIARENRIADPTKIYPGTILMIRVR